MITVDSIENGVVIDHIQAGTAMHLYRILELGKLGCPVAIFTNVRSKKYGSKDIIKIEGNPTPELGILAALDAQITLLRICDGVAVEKLQPHPPQRLVNVVLCQNPRCITACEMGVDHIFERTERGTYRCIYCKREMDLG